MTDRGRDTRPRIATVGMFDGVHLGHRHLLAELKDRADHIGAEPVALTFSRHPATLLHPGKAPRLISHAGQRCEQIRSLCGIETCEVMDFSREDFKATAAEFVSRLHRDHGIDALLMGFNNHIGSDRLTAAALNAGLSAMPALNGFKVFEASPCCATEYNSTAARTAILNGDMPRTQQILGHPFTIRGRVVAGKQLGRTIGFPTANIEPLAAEQLLPPDGVYAVAAHIDGLTLPGMANIGTRPTIDDGDRRTFEVHIIGFTRDIYGETIDIDIVSRLRDERHFPSVEALKVQLATDRDNALKVLGGNPAQ